MPGRIGNFATLRFLAALAVLWSHSFTLSGGQSAWEPFKALSGGQSKLGTTAVVIFLVISGYLVTRSFDHSASAWRFVKSRLLRIMPGLLAMLIVLGLIVGSLLTTTPLGEYFASKEFLKFFAFNGSLLGYWARLPGVFTENPQPFINGSSWTLRFQAECYLLVLFLGVLGLLNRYVVLALFLAGMAYLVLDGPYTDANFGQWNHRIDIATKFLAGAAIYRWRLELDGRAALSCALLWVLALFFGGYWLALPTAFAYLVIYVALAPIRLPDMERYGDLSYGMFLSAWPVQQLIIHSGLASTWLGVGLMSTAGSIGVALLSWHLLEKRVLSFKDRMLPIERRISTLVDSTTAALWATVRPVRSKT